MCNFNVLSTVLGEVNGYIAKWVRPVLSGWVRYYGRFYPSKLRDELRTIDAFIVR